MNMREFAALKVGDKISNQFSGSHGEVVETTDSGVRVCWGWNNRPTPQTAPTFAYTVQSTAWMHWSKPESNVSPELDKAISDELADKPASIVGEA